jgi:hypothetical protein
MPSNRPNLTLDQQFLQELLSAAYTIQQHNDRMGQAQTTTPDSSTPKILASNTAASGVPASKVSALQTPTSGLHAQPHPTEVCPHCGFLKAAEQAQCARCGLDEFRPGERMQRKWASMWLMSQQQGLWPERSVATNGGVPPSDETLEVKRSPRNKTTHDFAASGILSRRSEVETASGKLAGGKTVPGSNWTMEAPANNFAGDKPAENKLAQNALAEDGFTENGFTENGFTEKGFTKKKTTDTPSAYFTETESDPTIRRPRSSPGEASWFDTSSDDATHALDHHFDHVANHVADHVLGEDQSENRMDNASGYATDAITDDVSGYATDDATYDAINDTGNDLTVSDGHAGNITLLQRVADLRIKLRFHRADLYLGTAVFVAALALLWPAAGASKQAALSPWARALITLGIAEAPQPLAHVQGDPAIEVWVDPHSALYYCPGEEQYGKTADGRFNSQREAQMDRFEPASRSACE